MRSPRRPFHPRHRTFASVAAVAAWLLLAPACTAIDKIYDTEFSTTIHLFGTPASQPDSRPTSTTMPTSSPTFPGDATAGPGSSFPRLEGAASRRPATR